MNLVTSVGTRVLAAVQTLLLASIITFALVQFAPGDPAATITGDNASAEAIEATRERLGLDRSLVLQYLSWALSALRGDLGASYISGEPVVDAIARTLPVTLSLVLIALAFSVVVGSVLGIVAAWHANGLVDRLVLTLSSLGLAVPSFWLALILVSTFALGGISLFPATGYASFWESPVSWLTHLLLPAVAMGMVGAAEVARQLRSAMIQALEADHTRTLKAKGLADRRIIVHSFRNAGVPMLSVVGVQVARFMGATVVLETVFAMPGLGRLIVDATLRGDFIIIQGVVMVVAAFVIVINAMVDSGYRVVDPRIR